MLSIVLFLLYPSLMVQAYLYFSGRFSWDLNMKGMTFKGYKDVIFVAFKLL